MFSSLRKRFFALLFAPFFALCLVTATGCEEEEGVEGVGNGIEVDEGDLGEDELGE